jgi:hypothetical protein
VWIETTDNGQYLNADIVEWFSVEGMEDLHTVSAHMPSGETVGISTHRSFKEGVAALDRLMKRLGRDTT